MKRFLFLCSFLAFAFILSCERTYILKDAAIPILEETEEMQALTEATKKYYTKELRKNIEAGQIAAIDRAQGLKKLTKKSEISKPDAKAYALWKEAVTTTVDGVPRTEVPLSYSSRTVSLIKVARDSVGELPNSSMLFTIFDRLVVFHDGDGFRQKIVRFHPDKSYLERHGFDASHNYLHKLDEDFSGYLEYLEISGERRAIIRVVNGKPVRKFGTRARQVGSLTKTMSPDGPVKAMSDGWDCYEFCEDIWLEICVGNPFNPDDPDDMYCDSEVIGQNCWEECYPIEEPGYCDDPANWDDCWGQPDPDPDPEPEPGGPDEIDLSFCAGISPTDRATIENTLEAAASLNCATLKVNNALAGLQGLTLGMCVEGNGADTYSATTKTISFQTSYTASRSDVMMHELFHAYQDNVAYLGGIGVYGKDALGNNAPGFSNIEFEQALYTDIMMLHGSSATALYFSANGSIKTDYINWINTLTNNGTQYPNFSANWSVFETKYFEFMEKFRNSNPNYNAPIINTLDPEALKKIFNGLQPNCGN